MPEPETYRVRFRFRLQKKLNIVAREHRFAISGREVVLSPPLPDTNICDSEWLVMNARGFTSAAEVLFFGSSLKAACEISSVASRLGIDSGVGPSVMERSGQGAGDNSTFVIDV